MVRGLKIGVVHDYLGGDMQNIALVTDSTAYIPNHLLKEYDIAVVPLVLIWGDKTYEDGVDIQPEEFYTRLKTDRGPCLRRPKSQ